MTGDEARHRLELLIAAGTDEAQQHQLDELVDLVAQTCPELALKMGRMLIAKSKAQRSRIRALLDAAIAEVQPASE